METIIAVDIGRKCSATVDLQIAKNSQAHWSLFLVASSNLGRKSVGGTLEVQLPFPKILSCNDIQVKRLKRVKKVCLNAFEQALFFE